MCAQFMLRANARKLEARFGIKIPKEYDESGWSMRILPHGRGPVVLERGGERRLEPMQFSLLPAWSKEKRVKFATHNARIDGVAIKPTWKRVFAERRCVIPITDFIEPIYEGDYAGNMVDFHTPDTRIMAAAGLWDEWIDRETGEVIPSFTIITDEALPFVRQIGHDRSPLFLADDAIGPWLAEGKKDPAALLELLHGSKAQLELVVDKDRPLKAGWEKRR